MFWEQDTRIQKFEADGSQRDGGAALQGRGCGMHGFVGQLCGERKHVRERWPASEWKGGSSFCQGTVKGGRQCSVSWQVNTVTSCESRQFYSMNF